MFVQYTVEPAGTVTDAGMNVKFSMVTVREMGDAVVGTAVGEVTGGVVTVVATVVVGRGVAGGVVTVVGTGEAAGVCGAAQPARRRAITIRNAATRNRFAFFMSDTSDFLPFGGSQEVECRER
jgi:hypothetical protein